MIIEACGMYCIVAYFALHYIVLFVDVIGAPRAQVVIDQWTWPFVSVPSKVIWMEVKITIFTMFGDRFRYFAVAKGTLH